MSDYEYLLQCYSLWGKGSMAILPEELVLYVQTNEGIIGQSRYKDWVREFEYLWNNRSNYSIFQSFNPENWMPIKIKEFKQKADANVDLPGFPRNI
jgi:hypothetical protein